ncbi:epoxide hydrolase family protein [Nitratireductor sp. ac15]
MSSILPFKIDVSDPDLRDFETRIAKTRLPEAYDAGWTQGPSADWVRAMLARLAGGFDWRAQETRINRHPQFTAEIAGQTIHFLHVKSGSADAIPLMLLHGWPSSIVEYLEVIGPLTDPESHGQRGGQAFDLVIPSLPGFGFSGPTAERGWNNRRIAAALVELMKVLEYDRFAVHGTDAGAIIAPEMGRIAPDRIIGIHLSAATMGFIPMGPVEPGVMETLTEGEQVRIQRLQRFMAEHFGFNAIQSNRPMALAYALTDSPVGLLAWISELFTSFGDRPDAIDAEAFLTNFMIYWFTGTAASSLQLYYENACDPEAWSPKANSGVPTAVAVFGYDEVPIRHFGEQGNTIARWTELDRGGHFAALEEPALWAEDVRAFFSGL